VESAGFDKLAVPVQAPWIFVAAQAGSDAILRYPRWRLRNG
jgi:hypothetical protein